MTSTFFHTSSLQISPHHPLKLDNKQHPFSIFFENKIEECILSKKKKRKIEECKKLRGVEHSKHHWCVPEGF